MSEGRTLEQTLEDELDRLSDLIDDLAETGSAKNMRQALTAAGQLARLRERMVDRREPQQPEQPRPEANHEQVLESLRVLVRQHSYLLE